MYPAEAILSFDDESSKLPPDGSSKDKNRISVAYEKKSSSAYLYLVNSLAVNAAANVTKSATADPPAQTVQSPL